MLLGVFRNKKQHSVYKRGRERKFTSIYLNSIQDGKIHEQVAEGRETINLCANERC